jgi:hypothetical protein
MTLEQYALLAEILASVAVVITLIFVGIQLSHANRESRASTMQAAMFREIENSFRFADHAATWDKVLAGSALSEGEELRTGILLFNAFMTDSEYRFHQYRAGYLDPQTWQARMETLPLAARLPVYAPWRCSPGGQNHARDFLELMDRLANEVSQ